MSLWRNQFDLDPSPTKGGGGWNNLRDDKSLVKSTSYAFADVSWIKRMLVVHVSPARCGIRGRKRLPFIYICMKLNGLMIGFNMGRVWNRIAVFGMVIFCVFWMVIGALHRLVGYLVQNRNDNVFLYINIFKYSTYVLKRFVFWIMYFCFVK